MNQKANPEIFHSQEPPYQLLARAIVENVYDYSIFLLDSNGYVATWNLGAQRLKGYTEDEILGQHFSKFFPEDDIRSGKCDYELREAALTGRFEDENWRLRKDGTRFWANVVLTAVRNERGELLGFTKITRDLTERKRSEDKLRMLYNDLDRRVQERTAQLARSNEQLEKAIKARDEFLSMASHELKTPIMTLKNQLEYYLPLFIEKNADISLKDDVQAFRSTVEKQADDINQLIEDMLDASRASLGKLEYTFKRVNLAELARDAARQWEASLKKAGNSLKLKIEPGIFVQGSPARLEQVISNLLSNVIKYAPATLVEITLSKKEKEAILSVKDHGKGVDAKMLPKLFEKYNRAGQSPEIGGLGLGLYISHEIIKAHGGKLSARSEKGEGSAFNIHLPLV